MNRFTIRKSFSFSASHQLLHLPSEHPCRRMHGHNYNVELELSGNLLNVNDFIVDYRELDVVKRWLDETFDHQHLNDVPGMERPTAENIAAFIFNHIKTTFPQLTAVTVSETDKTSATYRPGE